MLSGFHSSDANKVWPLGSHWILKLLFSTDVKIIGMINTVLYSTDVLVAVNTNSVKEVDI